VGSDYEQDEVSDFLAEMGEILRYVGQSDEPWETLLGKKGMKWLYSRASISIGKTLPSRWSTKRIGLDTVRMMVITVGAIAFGQLI
jgi:hypothetical protein